MHCSPDLSEHIYDCCFELLITEIMYLCFIMKSVSGGVFLVCLFETYSLVSSFSLTLCVGFCALDKTATSPSLDRGVLCRI